MKNPIIWWHGKDLAPLFERVAELGAENVRVEFHPDTRLLYVAETNGGTTVAALGDGGEEGFNFSHICPPDCDEE